MTLTEFLLTRIAEDEKRADEWRYARGCCGACGTNNGKRALADSLAKGRVVELWSEFLDQAPDRAEDELPHLLLIVKWTLQQLALPYADHKDYREEWSGDG